MHTITVFIIQLQTKNNNYTAKAVLEREEGKAKTWCLPAEAAKASSPQLSRRGAPRSTPQGPSGCQPPTERQGSPPSPTGLWAPPERRPWVPTAQNPEAERKNEFTACGGGGALGSSAQGRLPGSQKSLQKVWKVQIDMIQSNCCHPKWFKNSPLICSQSQVKGHPRKSIFLPYKKTTTL